MANSVPSNYNPKKVVITFGGVPIDGYTDGTFINIAPNDVDGFKKKVGADGEVAWAQSSDNTHQITISLMQSSLSNTYLSGVRNTDKLTGKALLPLSITDLNGGSLHFWLFARIKGDPSSWGYGNELTERQWVIDTGQQAEDNKAGLLP
jgi:hypothetical protein